MVETGTELVKGLYASFARGDAAAVLAAMADDIEWHEAEGGPYGGLHRGPDEVAARVFGPLAADVPDFAVSLERVLPSGSAVAVVARYTGTGGATGRRLDLPVVHVWDVRADEVVSFRQFVDAAAFLEVVSADAGVSA